MSQLPVAHAQNILPDRVTSGHVANVTFGHVTDVTSGHVTSGCSTASLHRKYDLSCPHILLMFILPNALLITELQLLL
jgi:hypothetical protein